MLFQPITYVAKTKNSIARLKEIPFEEVKWVASYFAVVKSILEARAIYNGKKFSFLCNTPPPTNLPDMIALLAALCDLIEESGGAVTVSEGDIRHFFHQVPLEFSISQHFCINIEDDDGKVQFFRWVTLPMGWSFSPFIAQSISMGILIRTLEICGFDMQRYRSLETPPPFIKHRGDLSQKDFLRYRESSDTCSGSLVRQYTHRNYYTLFCHECCCLKGSTSPWTKKKKEK